MPWPLAPWHHHTGWQVPGLLRRKISTVPIAVLCFQRRIQKDNPKAALLLPHHILATPQRVILRAALRRMLLPRTGKGWVKPLIATLGGSCVRCPMFIKNGQPVSQVNIMKMYSALGWLLHLINSVLFYHGIKTRSPLKFDAALAQYDSLTLYDRTRDV